MRLYPCLLCRDVLGVYLLRSLAIFSSKTEARSPFFGKTQIATLFRQRILLAN
ncbi:hypothetical protein [Spirulina sp. 06S082]|uniref:hypothetical protein n=1 Tax=Spirulina sp. 06S082 TaxID=3110248 RepID=UPI002B1EE932|nr:hypothetical protein [Spirulina sp. 06S082]